ncbi:MAG: ABC transporter ATP-binding protein, partial [Pyrinomonadaceae bacterium]
LLAYLKPYSKAVVPALFLTLILNVLGVAQPKFTQYAIDWYILPHQLGGLKWLALGFLGVLLMRFSFAYVQDVLLSSVGQRVMYDLRSELYKKLQDQEVAYYDRTPVGRIMTRLTSDVDSLNELFTAGVVELLGDVVMIVAIVAMMLWMDWRLTLVSLITVPMMWAATQWFRHHARRGYDRVRTRLARINAFLQEHLSGAQTVQLFNREMKERERFHDVNNAHREANIETIFYYAVFYPLIDLVGAVGMALIIWYGGWRVLSTAGTAQMLTLGALVAFIQYLQQLFQPIRDISDKYNILQAAVVASYRIFKTLDRPVLVTSPTEPKRTGRAAGRIEF